MSAVTLQGIHDAIAAHLADRSGTDAILTDWFISFGSMAHDSDSSEGIAYGIHHATSSSSPQGSLGIALLGVGQLEQSLAPDDD